MQEHYSFGIMGGDLRQVYMANYLAENGHDVQYHGLKKELLKKGCKKADSFKKLLQKADILIGPVPFGRDGKQILSETGEEDLNLQNFMAYVREGSYVFAGCIPSQVMRFLKEQKVTAYDFMENEQLAIFNTIATAEGAVLEAIRHQPTNLHDSKSLVLGYGKCAKTLADKLKGMSAEVTIAARKESDLHIAQTLGCKVLHFDKLKEHIGRYEYIFNTVPDVVLKEEILEQVKEESLIIDIASMPGGVDYQAAERLGVHARHCLGLPGKYAPKASAESLAQVLLSWLSQPGTHCGETSSL